MIDNIIEKLTQHQSLTISESNNCMNQILLGNVANEQLVTFLTTLAEKKEVASELVGFLQAMMHHSKKIDCGNNTIDICGTGGSSKERFNVSTCVAFALAAAGVKVAKHGNYGSKKPNGSFNFLEELELPFNAEISIIETLFNQTQVCFLFARAFHPAMRHVAAARKQLGRRTVFNLLGPLANPAHVDYQLIGLPNNDSESLLIDVIQQLSRKKVLLVIGGDGRDEISLSGDSQIIEITNKSVNKHIFNFQKEIESCDDQYECGSSQENAQIFKSICAKNQWDHPIIKHIAINAAAGLYVMDKAPTLQEGYKTVMNLFKQGLVTDKISQYRQIASSLIQN
ncbi:anthranilate phosphoribosyltransferase [Candidatus Marinamargulisbacteria bacterium SCGC AG-414-C22]|nr:anthranilate phosphoribosyltransferase [Candidatus Marinamargulisbacteria bacterium SCGC AG-414-C22]